MPDKRPPSCVCWIDGVHHPTIKLANLKNSVIFQSFIFVIFKTTMFGRRTTVQPSDRLSKYSHTFTQMVIRMDRTYVHTMCIYKVFLRKIKPQRNVRNGSVCIGSIFERKADIFEKENDTYFQLYSL